ncbi:MAG: PAS domain-containing protein [Chloroflexi bacterium]|nr:PAS domain-containing protein [Chloroflexota bacterium]
MTKLNSRHSIESAISEGSQSATPSTSLTSTLDGPSSEFPIVGIGASAGGLEAFEQLFTSMPADTGMAFVLVQHLSPPHKSILPEIIQRFTAMPVSQVTDGIQVKPNCVYVIPPGSDLALINGHLQLLKRVTTGGFHLPIDFFFTTLAQVLGERAIGVVLSGSGSDGSLGLKSIKAEGGLTIAQAPETAVYADMPRNAIATQEVDFTLPPDKMGELILKYIHHQVLTGYESSAGDLVIPTEAMQKLYFLLHAKTGHDFSLYKQTSLQRRIQRRMKITLVKNLETYLIYLQDNPEEIEVLFREMLINVTHFFRDPDAFQALIEKAIRPLISIKKATHSPLRVWVAGCSTGEEAYSIAIAIQEEIEALKTDCPVQIYATDIDKESILVARAGIYSSAISADVSPERLKRFFSQKDQTFQIKKNIRDRVVFAPQNLISDPPFSKIDLLCCRNLLIYLEPALQNQLFPLFHYSLNPEGFLFLGNSESISGFSNLFAAVDRKHKLFRRKEAITQGSFTTKIGFTHRETVIPTSEPASTRPITVNLREWTEKTLLEYYSPACVVINEKHNILFIHGRTGKYLEPASGEASNNLLMMARQGLKTELATAIHTAITHRETVQKRGLQVKTNGEFQPVNLTIRPITELPDLQGLILVVFEEVPASPVLPVPQTTNREPQNRRIAALKKELKEKDVYLQTIIEELENANQELKLSNEELQSSNEEMQSTNEEMETSKEELQSINEELATLNAELQKKNEELSWANNDLYNLLASTEIATLFLDLDLHIRRFTPTIHRIYNLLSTDTGRPIGDFVSHLMDNPLVEYIQQVLATLIPKAVEVQAEDGTWYLESIKPYRTLENVIDGVVITFVDITKQKHGDELRRMGTVLQDSNDAVTVQDFRGKIMAWNRGAAQMYGWSDVEALTMNSFDLIPEHKRAEAITLFHRLSRGEVIPSHETQRVTSDGRTLDVWMTLTALVDDANQPVGVATTERDITDRKRANQRLSYENRAFKAVNYWYKTLRIGPEPESWLEEVGRILVEEGGYRLAWIGRVDKNQPKVIPPVTWAWLEDGDPEPASTFQPLEKLAQGPVESALRSGQPVAVRNIHTDPEQKDLRADALKYKYGSLVVLPLINIEEDRLGVLVIYATEPDAFEEQEVEILITFSESIVRGMDPGNKEQMTLR